VFKFYSAYRQYRYAGLQLLFFDLSTSVVARRVPECVETFCLGCSIIVTVVSSALITVVRQIPRFSFELLNSCLKKPFGSNSFSDEQNIINKGRPTPKLQNLKSKSRKAFRYFNPSFYDSNKWLSGCEKTQKL